MRGRIQFQGDIPYVFTGSVRSRMVGLFDNPDSAFYKSALTLCVGEIERDSFAAFLQSRFETGHRRVSDDTVRAIMDAVADVPGDVQQLCEAAWGVTEDGVAPGGGDGALRFAWAFTPNWRNRENRPSPPVCAVVQFGELKEGR